MPTLSTSRLLPCAAASLFLAAVLPVTAHAQPNDRTGVASTSHKTRHKGNANQPAPTEHQTIPPSERLKDEPNQVKEQVAPVPTAPIKPGTNTNATPDASRPHGA